MFFLYLIRHGQAECNVKKIFPGRDCKNDLPLTDLGRQQAKLTAIALYELIEKNQRRYVLYHSPSKRTFETANIICEKNNAKSHSDEGLLFRGQGIVAGLTYDEVGIRYPEYYMQKMENVNFIFPEAEARECEYKRVVNSWLTIRKKYLVKK